MDKQLRVKISDNNFEWRFDDSLIIFKFIKTKSQILVSSLNTKNAYKNLVAYNINSDLRPVFRNKKIADDIKVAEAKPPFINQQCVVYKFKCDLCYADYVGYTCLHLFQRIEEHKHPAIGKHLRDAHNQKNKDRR